MSQAEYNTGINKYCRIQEPERKTIQRMKQQGASANEIARLLRRHRSTIGRELKRNAVIQRETIQRMRSAKTTVDSFELRRRSDA